MEVIVKHNRVIALLLAGCLAGSVLLAQSPKKGPAPPPEKQQELVTEAGQTLDNFLADPEMTWIKKHHKEALGFLISPMIMKAGFIIGGSGGRAVLIAKGAKGAWRGPAFYTLATPSVGFQAGVEKIEFIAMVMTKKGLDSLMKSTMKIGGDASFAIGPIGAGAGTIPKGDFVIFSRTKGVYGGVNVEGTAVKVEDEFNNAYYGEPVTPLDIIARGSHVNPAADAPLLSKASKASK
jgi:lipid-binding SYLF domain-containing protein